MNDEELDSTEKRSISTKMFKGLNMDPEEVEKASWWKRVKNVVKLKINELCTNATTHMHETYLSKGFYGFVVCIFAGA